MNKSEQPTPTNYAEAAALLWTHNGSRNSLKIANNTYLETRGDGIIYVRLHGTDVATFFEDGVTKLSSGGYRSKTTIERLNRYLPQGSQIAQRDGKWRYFSATLVTPVVAFHDGITIDSNTGEVLS